MSAVAISVVAAMLGFIVGWITGFVLGRHAAMSFAVRELRRAFPQDARGGYEPRPTAGRPVDPPMMP